MKRNWGGGGDNRSDSQLSLGRQCFTDCNLLDLNFAGYPFTWSNGRQGEENIQCGLDRACSNSKFQARFFPIQVTHLPRFGSDHAAILIHLEAPNSEYSYLRKFGQRMIDVSR